MDLEYYILIGFISIALSVLGSAFYLRKTKPMRTIAKGNQTAILDHYNVLMTINEDQKLTINSQRQKVAMLQKKMTELEGYEEEPEEPQINVQQFIPLANKLGIDNNQLQSIMSDPKVKKWLNKKDNLELLQIALPFLSSKLGNQSNTLNQGTLPPGEVPA